jgi:2-amino-4-hydroxy-6-hydroxymethyldihydropteridine diphosphokinase
VTTKIARYWLGLGANLGERSEALSGVVSLLSAAGVQIEASSRLFETAPREIEDQPSFLNGAVRAASELSPREMLALVKRIEGEVGRTEGRRYGPRVADCDLLLWSRGAWRDEALEIPHPRLAERRFALLPLLDIDPELALPDGRRIADLAAEIDPTEQPAVPIPISQYGSWTGSFVASH